ncbi:mannose-6-phosphate isomerase [Glomus cerebriforme]|uniref:Mannose-6-phosphate isomerase n=1 Tax=Glomus cerebriforme TaxID=658196 RepID=A0A397TEY0_9GLOM|nr:mannose-6-phosphate isomerase [Glomus cerebriforme]
MSKPAVYKLKCAVQNYDWGKVGSESKVAQFAQNSNDFEIQLDKPYAELWMGTHPNGPSVLAEQPSNSLKEKIESNPDELLSPEISKIYGDLPFLFKVLSVRKALSIQAHPDKKLGKELFEKFPKIYKDPNHKPEMAVAITDFEALCGFRPLEEIKSFLNEYPELVELIGNEISSRFLQIVNGREVSQFTEDIELNKSALCELFTKIMTTNESIVSQQVDKLIKRLKSNNSSLAKGSIPELLIRLNNQFPGDVGIFCVLLLNYIKLDPGQAMFLGANEPHAYLSGDIVECMAASDNVVRAGLTPKFKDVNVLTNMLTYRYDSAKSQILASIPYNNNKLTVLYDPPIEEFSVSMTRFNSLEKKEAFDGIPGPSIIIVIDGKGTLKVDNLSESLEPGSVFFIGANVPIIIEAVADSDKLDLFRAFCTL